MILRKIDSILLEFPASNQPSNTIDQKEPQPVDTVHLIKLFSPQLNYQTDSDFLINTPLLQPKNQEHSLNTFNDQNNTENAKWKMKWLTFSLRLYLILLPELNFLQNLDSLATLKVFEPTCNSLLFNKNRWWWWILLSAKWYMAW